MSGSDGSFYWRMLEDIRRLEEQQRRLDQITRHQAIFDDPVRLALEQQNRLEQAVRRSQIVDEPFRRGIEQQRQIDEATSRWRIFDELQIARRQSDFMSLLPVQRALQDLGRLPRMSSLDDSLVRRFGEAERLLRLSANPYPDVPSLDLGAADQAFRARFGRINTGLYDAGLLAEVEFGGDPDSAVADATEIENQLIEVVPAEALEALRRVEFVPFSLLMAAVTNPRILFDVPPRTFEQFIAELMSRLGVQDVILTPERADGGRDVIGTVKVADIPLILAFECKRYTEDNPVSVETARALLGTITHGDYRADRGILVTTSRFTEPAQRFILTAPQLDGRDFNGVVAWLRQFAQRRRQATPVSTCPTIPGGR